MINLPVSPRPGANGRKRILLVDSYATKRDLRAKVLRKMGVEVDCASDISAARSLWQADAYNLVLLAVEREPQNVEAFCVEIRSAKPPQKFAFLVGKPDYLGASPRSDTVHPLAQATTNGLWSEMVASLFTTACELLPRRYGFLEASWRIAATRSQLKDPRPKAVASEPAAPGEPRNLAPRAHSAAQPSAAMIAASLLPAGADAGPISSELNLEVPSEETL
jgi:hypothetical protein